MTVGGDRWPSLLLVEDDSDDQRFFQWAVQKSGIRITVNLAADGEQAIEFLSHPPPRLFLILSDIHLPRKSGWDVLHWVRTHPGMERLPMLLWTSLPNPEGALRALTLGATSYFSKPIGTDGYRRVVETVAHYLRD